MASLFQGTMAILPASTHAGGQARVNRLLAALPAADYACLVAHLNPVSLERGKILQESGEAVGQVYFLYGGMLSLLTVLPDGETVETMTVGREGALGLMTGLGSHIAWQRAIVQLPGHAGQIAAPRWSELVQECTALRDLALRYNDLQLAYVQQSVACKALHEVESRLCRWLLEARDRVGSNTLALTQEFLADVLGVRRTTVTVVARVLQSAGLVHYRRGVIHIRDVAGLESAACECYHAVRSIADRLFGPEG